MNVWFLRPHPLVDGRHLVLLGATGRRVARRDPAHGHLGVTFALRTLHPHELHVVVLVEAERHPLGHLRRDAHLRGNVVTSRYEAKKDALSYPNR